jgi:hypothetical protein
MAGLSEGLGKPMMRGESTASGEKRTQPPPDSGISCRGGKRMRTKCAKLALLILGATFVSACSTVAPPYAVSTDNVETLKRSGASPARVGKFDVPEGLNKISMRASSMTSPVEGSYGAYLADAIRQELSLAKLLDPKSSFEISGGLLKNDVDIGGFITGSAILEARVVVKKDGEIRYDKVKSATTQFDSNFIGAIAIPRGIQSYPVVVGKFVGALFSDPEFIAALK